jgi:hypothetical protein
MNHTTVYVSLIQHPDTGLSYACLASTLSLPLEAEYDPSNSNVLYLKILFR